VTIDARHPHREPFMLDPITSLAFTLHSTKGVYALLLGSGISRSAKIPTGWEITLELVRKVAALEGADCEPDPAVWFRRRFGSDPDYAQMLDGVAKTPAERQQLLRGYWEPTEEERAEGAKQPTEAHRAVAELVKRGYVRVLVTTNFDRLMEFALQEVGIQPTVLSTPDHVAGAMPLIHTACTVVKVHGDYLDTRIRNTPAELATYAPETNGLLDRVFDEFGLIVCGWSADWDEALRAAINRAPSRRFSTYWAARGDLSEIAKGVVQNRLAQIVPIADADAFFSQLVEKVQALEEFNRPHPLSTEAAVASQKKYLSEPRYRIQLDDIVRREVARVIDAVKGSEFGVNGVDVNTESVTRRVQAYEAASETLMAIAFVAGRWSDAAQSKVWSDSLAILAQERGGGGVIAWIELHRYPATLLLYAFGLGAAMAGNYRALAVLFATTVQREHRDPERALDGVAPANLLQNSQRIFQLLPHMERRHVPLSDWLHDLLKLVVSRESHDMNSYTLFFDRLEILIALAYAAGDSRSADRFWAPPGSYGYRSDTRDRNLAVLRSEIAGDGATSPFIDCRAFGSTPAQCEQLIANLVEFISKLHMW
jgi:hypothetical protein